MPCFINIILTTKMPLIVKDYNWNQNDDFITIQVPLKGVPPSNVDIFTSDNYIKANFPPFFFEVFLNSAIDENRSKCSLSDDAIIFELQKTIPQKWESLTADLSKMEMLEKRQQIIEKHQRNAEKNVKTKREKMASLKRFAVQRQIEKDSATRHIIDERRNSERSKAMEDLEQWKTTKMKRESNPTKEIYDESSKSLVDEERPLSQAKDSGENASGKSISASIFPVPLPRNPGSVTINFTHRDFPTPSRESQAPQEEEWLKKQVEARRATGFVAEDLRPEECNPSWLKDKGDSFYKTGNFLGAVSAYSHAIKLGSKMASLYSNRAAAHLGLGNFHKALDDCSKALELMTPHVSANLEGRAKCHARRGAILCRLGLPEAGLADFEEALKLKPNDEKLLDDLEHAKLMVRTKPDEEDKFDGIEIVPS